MNSHGFAFLPVILDDQSVLWLDFYWECHRMMEIGEWTLLSITQEYPDHAVRPQQESPQ